jgi:hypothetical protein
MVKKHQPSNETCTSVARVRVGIHREGLAVVSATAKTCGPGV